MKRLTRWLSRLSLICVACLGIFVYAQPGRAENIIIQPVPVLAAMTELPDGSNAICPEFEQKIDLNNANIIAFKDCQEFYPNLASLIITNSPYEEVEDVLDIPGLSPHQKELLQSQMKNFMLTEPRVSLEMRMPPRPMMR